MEIERPCPPFMAAIANKTSEKRSAAPWRGVRPVPPRRVVARKTPTRRLLRCTERYLIRSKGEMLPG
jgi:hypothetical protein